MSAYNRVIWSDGLFLQPQHFQQQDRAFERYVESRCHALTPFSWGFTEIEFETDLLRIGKIGLRRLAGVFPDGTPFRMPDDEPLPAAIDVSADVRNERLFLAVPLRRPGEVEVMRGAADGLVRYEVREEQARSAVASSGEPTTLEVGALRTRLVLESEATEAYAQIPLAHIVECRSDRHVVLDDQFMPTVLRVSAAPRLTTLMTEVLGLFRQRGDALGGRASASSQSTAAELGNFLMLQIVNRYEPLFAHLSDTQAVHPEALYQILGLCGGRARDAHRVVAPHTALPGLSPRTAPGIVRAGRRVAARVDEPRDGTERHSNPAGAATVRDQRGDRPGSIALQLRRVRAGGARGRTGGSAASTLPRAGSRRSDREDYRPRASGAPRRAGRSDPRGAATDSVPRRLCVLRARFDPTRCGNS
ncbi:MAG: type VI secretion system baseplate subunit TssK [Vicinamibacterales bacterium]